MKQFEYIGEVLSFKASLITKANELGSLGWELVVFSEADDYGSRLAIFKREKPRKSKRSCVKPT